MSIQSLFPDLKVIKVIDKKGNERQFEDCTLECKIFFECSNKDCNKICEKRGTALKTRKVVVCNTCNKNKNSEFKTLTELKDFFIKNNSEIKATSLPSRRDIVEWKCNECKNFHSTSLNSVFISKTFKCEKCKDNKETRFVKTSMSLEELKELFKKNGSEILYNKQDVRMKDRCEWKCKECKKVINGEISKIIHHSTYLCRSCGIKLSKPNYVDYNTFKKYFENKGWKVLSNKEDYKNNKKTRD